MLQKILFVTNWEKWEEDIRQTLIFPKAWLFENKITPTLIAHTANRPEKWLDVFFFEKRFFIKDTNDWKRQSGFFFLANTLFGYEPKKKKLPVFTRFHLVWGKAMTVWRISTLHGVLTLNKTKSSIRERGLSVECTLNYLNALAKNWFSQLSTQKKGKF